MVEAREAAALRKVLPPAQPTPWEHAWLDPLLSEEGSSAEEEPAAGQVRVRVRVSVRVRVRVSANPNPNSPNPNSNPNPNPNPNPN